MSGYFTPGYFIEDLQVGMEAVQKHDVSEHDIIAFAEISGDTNPVHLDEDYAAHTRFKGRIAHGILTASYISAVLGTKLPGAGAIYISQTLKFRAPVRIGDTVVTRVRISELNVETRRVVLACSCCVGDTLVLEGDATLLVPSRVGG